MLDGGSCGRCEGGPCHQESLSLFWSQPFCGRHILCGTAEMPFNCLFENINGNMAHTVCVTHTHTHTHILYTHTNKLKIALIFLRQHMGYNSIHPMTSCFDASHWQVCLKHTPLLNSNCQHGTVCIYRPILLSACFSEILLSSG